MNVKSFVFRLAHNRRLPIRQMMQFSSESGMKDEYGTMDSSGEMFKTINFQLESGQVLPEAEVWSRCEFGSLT